MRVEKRVDDVSVSFKCERTVGQKGPTFKFYMGNKSSVCGDRCSGRMVHVNQFVWPEQKRPAGPQRDGQTGVTTTTAAGALRRTT